MVNIYIFASFKGSPGKACCGRTIWWTWKSWEGCRQALAPILQQGALCQGSNLSRLSVPLSPLPTFLPPHPGPGLSVYIQSVMEAERENSDFAAHSWDQIPS